MTSARSFHFLEVGLDALSYFQLLAAVAHRDAAALNSPLLHGEAVPRRARCRQCIDGDRGEQPVWSALVPCCRSKLNSGTRRDGAWLLGTSYRTLEESSAVTRGTPEMKVRTRIALLLQGSPPVRGSAGRGSGSARPGFPTLNCVASTTMPDLGRTRPDAAPDAGRRPRTPAGWCRTPTASPRQAMAPRRLLRARPARIPRGTPRRAMQLFTFGSIQRDRTWGGEKNNFFNSRY